MNEKLLKLIPRDCMMFMMVCECRWQLAGQQAWNQGEVLLRHVQHGRQRQLFVLRSRLTLRSHWGPGRQSWHGAFTSLYLNRAGSIQ